MLPQGTVNLNHPSISNAETRMNTTFIRVFKCPSYSRKVPSYPSYYQCYLNYYQITYFYFQPENDSFQELL